MSKKSNKTTKETSQEENGSNKLTAAKRRVIFESDTKVIIEEMRRLLDQHRKLGENKGKEFTWEQDKTSTIINKTKLDNNTEFLIKRILDLREIAFPSSAKPKKEVTAKGRRGPRPKYGKISQGFLNLLEDENVKFAPYMVDGKKIALKDYLKSLSSGYSSDKLIMEVLKNYKDTNKLSSLATSNIGKEKVNNSFLGADSLLKDHLKTEFDHLKSTKVGEEKDAEKQEQLFDIDNMRYLGTFNNIGKYIISGDMEKNDNIAKYEEELDKIAKDDLKMTTFSSIASSIDDSDPLLQIRVSIDTDFFKVNSLGKGSKNETEETQTEDDDDDSPPPVIKQ